jgi:hypothetical protein
LDDLETGAARSRAHARGDLEVVKGKAGAGGGR